MNKLNYEVLKKTGYPGYILENAPEKVMQFGEGNFLRAFVDDFIDIANEKAGFNGKVVLVQPIAQGLTDLINAQQGLYTLYLRGSEKGVKVDDKRVISAVSTLCGYLLLEASALVDRVVELGERVAEFRAVDEILKTLGEHRVGGLALRERGILNGIIIYYRRLYEVLFNKCFKECL